MFIPICTVKYFDKESSTEPPLDHAALPLIVIGRAVISMLTRTIAYIFLIFD